MADLHTRTLTLTRAPGDTFDASARTIPVIASSEAIDSYGEVIDQASWRLTRFLNAPVALYQHAPWEEPVGFYRNVRVESGVLRMDLVLYEGKADPSGRAEAILARYAQGGPISVSVGFELGRSEKEQRDGRDVRVLYDCELHETSVVTIGANPDAVALRARRALMRARRGRMTLSEYLKERGMSPEECAEATGLALDALTAMAEGKARPTAEECAAMSEGLGLTDDEVMAMFPAEEPAEEDKPPAEDPPKGDPPAEEAAKQLREIHALLGVKDHGAARGRVKALLHLATTRASERKSVDAERAKLAKASEAAQVTALLAKARTGGRVTKINEAAVATHLKGASVSEARAYLDTLVPQVDVVERQPPDDLGGASALAVQIGQRAGFSAKQLADAAAANDARRAERAQH